MANYTTGADLVDAILFAAGEPTDGTSDFNSRALELLNRAYRALWTGGGELLPGINETWWWLRKALPGVLTLTPAITAGTVLVTNNSTAATLSSAPSVDCDNWYFKVDTHPDVFRISAHTAAATALTLDSVYTGPTAAAAAYKLFKLEYDLASDVLSLVSPMRAYQDGRREIDGVELSALERDYPLSEVGAGVPQKFSVVAETSAGVYTVRFSHYGGDGSDSAELIRVDYDYNQVPSDLTDAAGSVPLVPKEYRHVLSDFATGWLLSEKNDDRASEYFGAAKSGVSAMVLESRRRQHVMGRSFGRIYARQADMPHSQSPIRTESGMILG